MNKLRNTSQFITAKDFLHHTVNSLPLHSQLVSHRTNQIEIRDLIVGEDCASNIENPEQVNTFVHKQHTEVNSTYQEQCFLFIIGAGRSARGEVACFASSCPKKRIHMN